MFLFVVPGRRRRWKSLLSLLVLAFLGGAVIGCGGMANMAAANPGSTPGTTTGTYTVTVTGTSGATVQSTPVSVGVN